MNLILVVSPFLVIIIAEIIVNIYEFLFFLLAIGSDAIKNPGEAALEVRKIREDIQIFHKIHKRELKHLVGKKRMHYYIQHSDAPFVLKILSENMLKDPVYDGLLWIAFPLEFVIRRVKSLFE